MIFEDIDLQNIIIDNVSVGDIYLFDIFDIDSHLLGRVMFESTEGCYTWYPDENCIYFKSAELCDIGTFLHYCNFGFKKS